ncbi:MAG: family 1 glycosylhydrolase [Lachnospiraceae bacterium]|nr:family 1 glycosylhydrolase [Lachnospiraceae bacterium]
MNHFLIGAATSAHQVEGNNVNADCWIMENAPGTMWKEPSGAGVDHYNRFREDIDYLAAEGLNAYRFTIEWARIQPEEGMFDESAFLHYQDVIEYCIKKGITPIVTLHHFSTPAWVIKKGGWKSEAIITYFADYCRAVIKRLGDKLKYICTINEANMGLQMMKIAQQYADNTQAGEADNSIQIGMNMKEIMKNMEIYQKAVSETFGRADINSFLDMRTAEEEILVMRAHEAARKAIKEEKPELKVGVTLSLFDYQVKSGGEELAEKFWQEDFGIYFPYMQEDDFIGVQNYTRKIIGPEGPVVPENARLTEAGYEFYPQAVANVVRRVASLWQKEIIVTENGISTSDDKNRAEFISIALQGIRECIQDGIPIIGYCHWSLLDNFEWQMGYGQKFGLISVDRTTMERTVKPSLHVLGKELELCFGI